MIKQKITKNVELTTSQFSLEYDEKSDTVILWKNGYNWDTKQDDPQVALMLTTQEYYNLTDLFIELTKHMMIDTDTEYGEVAAFDDIFTKHNQIDMDDESEIL